MDGDDCGDLCTDDALILTDNDVGDQNYTLIISCKSSQIYISQIS